MSWGIYGRIEVSAIGGVPPYKYSINGNTPQSSSLFEGLVAGNYMIKLIDHFGNTATTSATLCEPVALTVTITKENATSSQDCKNGKATASVVGGMGLLPVVELRVQEIKPQKRRLIFRQERIVLL